MAAKFCAICGNGLGMDAVFCSGCGNDVSSRMNEPLVKPSLPKKRDYNPTPSQQTVIARPQYQVTPETSNKVESNKVEYGEFWPRLIAWIIDMIIIAIITLILTPMRMGFSIQGVVAFFVAWMYFFLLENSNDGQTLGKMAFNLRTVDRDTLKQAESGKYLIDSLTKGNPALLFVDVLFGLITKPGNAERTLRFSQNLANTVVIKTV